jgi:glycosyltransferase involved in cell wall biosynthesis
MSELHEEINFSTRPTRVCLVGPSQDMVGGQAMSAARLLKRLRENPQLDVSFLAIDARLPSVLRPLKNVKYIRTLATSIAYFISLFIRIPRVDVVHVFSASYWSFLLAPVPAMMVARLFRKGIILNYRSGEADDHLSRWRSAIPLCRLAHAIVVPSGYLVDVFARYGLRAQAVPNFVELDQLPYRQRELLRPVFISNRNFEAHYNVSCILRAFQRIQVNFPDASILIVGDGPLREQLRQESLDLGLRNASFLGAVKPKEMASLYDKADICLNTPYIDNMPNTLLEAAACGLPIVSTDAGGIPYIMKHEVTAMLVKCDDDAGLAAAAIRLLENPKEASRIANAARVEVLEFYTWPMVQKRWMSIYQALSRRASEA